MTWAVANSTGGGGGSDPTHIEFTLTVQGNGWAAVGFNTVPLMAGADMCVGWIPEGGGDAVVFDAYASGHTQPIPDTDQSGTPGQNNVELVASSTVCRSAWWQGYERGRKGHERGMSADVGPGAGCKRGYRPGAAGFDATVLAMHPARFQPFPARRWPFPDVGPSLTLALP